MTQIENLLCGFTGPVGIPTRQCGPPPLEIGLVVDFLLTAGGLSAANFDVLRCTPVALVQNVTPGSHEFIAGHPPLTNALITEDPPRFGVVGVEFDKPSEVRAFFGEQPRFLAPLGQFPMSLGCVGRLHAPLPIRSLLRWKGLVLPDLVGGQGEFDTLRRFDQVLLSRRLIRIEQPTLDRTTAEELESIGPRGISDHHSNHDDQQPQSHGLILETKGREQPLFLR